MTSREKFEALAKGHYILEWDEQDGDYYYSDTAGAWWGYQAALGSLDVVKAARELQRQLSEFAREANAKNGIVNHYQFDHLSILAAARGDDE